jgi:tryptophan halogenase
LEATGIIFVEVAAAMLANLFPWGGEIETAARQYNAIMLKRYERARDFIKMHYSLTERRDSRFWCDNADSSTSPDSLRELIERWRFRPPGSIDIDPNVDIFTEASWQYVLYGMGYKTDLRPRAGVFKYYDDARATFAEIRRQAEYACRTLPLNRDLLETVRARAFGSAS